MGSSPFSLEGKTILLTGASSGIGRQCAIELDRAGAKVILVARDEMRLRDTLSLLSDRGHQIVVQDINQLEKNFIKDLVGANGSFDGFVHCAGVEKTYPLKFLSRQDYLDVMSTNVLSAFELMRQLSTGKAMRDSSSVVFISSISSLIGRAGLTSYAASKGAMNSAMRVMAVELSKRKIRVNCISPGTVLTPMMEKVLNEMTDEDRQKRLNGFPLGLGRPEDVAYGCIYLLSDAARWITGQNLVIDGGFTAQ